MTERTIDPAQRPAEVVELEAKALRTLVERRHEWLNEPNGRVLGEVALCVGFERWKPFCQAWDLSNFYCRATYDIGEWQIIEKNGCCTVIAASFHNLCFWLVGGSWCIALLPLLLLLFVMNVN